MRVRRAGAGDVPAVLALVRAAFAYMDGVVDPPSSVHRLTEADLAGAEVWLAEAAGALAGALTLEPRTGYLYLGKFAVDAGWRGKGVARALVAAAEARARELGLKEMRLQTRVELTANHATFRALGFVEAGATAHPGYDRPTSLTFAKEVAG